MEGGVMLTGMLAGSFHAAVEPVAAAFLPTGAALKLNGAMRDLVLLV